MKTEDQAITSTTKNDMVSVTVRLFGTAKQAAGVTKVTIDVSSHSSDRQLAWLVRQSVPALAGLVIDEETRGLKPSHTFNLNGMKFIDGEVELHDGDEILLFSSQAGG